MNFEKCTRKSNQKIVSLSESGRKYILNNKSKKQLAIIKIDGCLITSNKIEKCDFLIEIDEPQTLAIYIELKGKNIEKAYNQLINTMNMLEKRHKKIKKECQIVSSRVPKSGTSVANLKANMMRTHKTLLKVGTNEVKRNI